MESLPRSPHSSRNHSTATRASSSSSSLTLKSPYRDVLFSDGGKGEFGAHKFAEIFPGSPSSIPVLDLSGLDEGVGSGDSRISKLDYPTIFSGLRDGDVTVPFDEVLGCAQKKTETRNPAHAPSHDRESISRKTKMPSGDPPDPFLTGETSQHFSISFSKSTLSTIRDPPNGEVHLAQLHGVPFTYFADNNNPQKAKKEDAPNYSSLPKGEVSRKWSFSTVEEVTTAKDGSSIPKKATLPNKNGSEHLPPLFNEESDENSLAALSAAALKKAVEQAEESIRIAKTIMEREKERFLEGSLGSRSKGLLSKERKKIRLENGPEKVRENVRGVKDGLDKRGESRNVGRKVKANDACVRGETIGRMEGGDGVDKNKVECEKEFVVDEHLKEFSGDLWNKSGSRVEEYAVEQDEIGERVDEIREVESDEKKRHFGDDGETLCEEFRQHMQVEENNFSEARKSETSRHSEEINSILDGIRYNISGFDETRCNDSMTVSSESREQSDVDSNNEAEEYQEDGRSGSQKTENAGLMNDRKNEKEGSLESKEEPSSVHGVRESEENENEAISGKEELKNVTGQSETDRNSSNEISKESKDSKANEQKFEKDYQQQRIEAIKRGREREKDRIVVERAIREARERAFAEARERAERERAARERGAKAAEGQEKPPPADKAAAAEARIRAARAMVERATAEACERALEKAMSEKTSAAMRTPAVSSSSSRNGLRHSFSSSDLERVDGKGGESAQRRDARLERHHRTMERAAKALAEKNMRDFLAQKEQADRNRLAESLDADIKRWVRGKEGNLRALLSTLQYILGPDSGWQPVSLTEIISTAAAKKAYRKATLCVHPDKLQQRGANIQQKYICEKVFDLLKAAWNRFDTEER